MSFGFGVGDFLAVFELANKVRDKWIDAPKEYKTIKDETKNVENILRDIGELGTRIDLDTQHEADLKRACQSCLEVLENCENLVDKCSSIQDATSSRSKIRRTWTRLRTDPDDIRHLRDQLSAQLIQLGLLHDAIETDLLIDVHEAVQNLQLNDAQSEIRAVADWHSNTDFADQQTDQLSRRETGTGGWLLTHSEYQCWRQQSNSTLLCPGISGSGKSMMVATVVDDLRHCFMLDRDIAVIYFYCNFKRRTEQRLCAILSTLIRQLFQEQAQLPEAVAKLYQAHRNRGTRPSKSELKNVLHELVASHRRVFVVIDALDECSDDEQQRDHLLDELLSLQALKSKNTNILATSRYIPDIVGRFSACPQLEIRASEHDLDIYLTRRMPGLSSSVSKDAQLQHAIKQQITDAAKGMFLLARLQFDSLRDKTTVGEMEDALAELKKGSDALTSAYDDALTRVDSQLPGLRKLARKVLMWIVYAKRELSVGEIQEAIAVQPGRKDLDLRKYFNEPDQMVAVCHGLVEVDQQSQIIRLVHYTAQEYFEKYRDKWLPDGDLHISRICIAYLMMDMFGHDQCKWRMDLTTQMQKYKFLEYAGKNWGVHARTVRYGELQSDILTLLLEPNYQKFSAMITFGMWIDDGLRKYYCWESDISAMHVSSHFRLSHLMRDLIDRGENINREDSFAWTPLHCAVEVNSVEVVQQLLAQPSIDVNIKTDHGETPLFAAAERGYCDILQLLLLQPDIDINPRDEDGCTPLSISADNGYSNIAQSLLLQPGIEINTRDMYGDTPLSAAAEHHSWNIVQLLLARPEIDLNMADSGHCVLGYAIEAKKKTIIQQLIAIPHFKPTDIENLTWGHYIWEEVFHEQAFDDEDKEWIRANSDLFVYKGPSP